MSSWDERFVHCTLKSVLKRKVCLCVWMGGGGGGGGGRNFVSAKVIKPFCFRQVFPVGPHFSNILHYIASNCSALHRFA